jgi:hypothetical protein
MSIEIQPPNEIILSPNHSTIFLGGSIGVDKPAEQWQRKVIEELKDMDYVFLNPRRNDWDSTWTQSINDENFYKQVTWELEGLEKSDIIVMYFDPTTSSPISLLELGLHARNKKMIVCCPDGFWRKGNVDIVCKTYNILQLNSLDEIITFLKLL